MSWIFEGGPFALFTLLWGALSVRWLWLETRERPSWTPGLHGNLLSGFAALGLAGWLLGLAATADAIADLDPEARARLGALGTDVSAIPSQIALGVALVLAPWMAWNDRHADHRGVRPAPALRWMARASRGLLGVALFLTIGPTLTNVWSDVFPQTQVEIAGALALLSLPCAIVSITLGRRAAALQRAEEVRHEQVRRQPLRRSVMQ